MQGSTSGFLLRWTHPLQGRRPLQRDSIVIDTERERGKESITEKETGTPIITETQVTVTTKRTTETVIGVEIKVHRRPPGPRPETTPILVGVAEEVGGTTTGTGNETETTIGETEMDTGGDGARTVIATTPLLATSTTHKAITQKVGGAMAITATTGKREVDTVAIEVGVAMGVVTEEGTGDTLNLEVSVLLAQFSGG